MIYKIQLKLQTSAIIRIMIRTFIGYKGKDERHNFLRMHGKCFVVSELELQFYVPMKTS